METIGPQDVTVVRADDAGDPVELVQRQRKGEALADVLLGTYNPSGRTPETWYQSVGQIPRDLRATRIRPVGPDRPHVHVLQRPGLLPVRVRPELHARSTFSNLQVSNTTPTADDTIHVSVDVTNTGSRDGNEIVEMYVNTPNADPSLRAADQAAGGLPEGLPRRRPDEDGDAPDQDRRPRVLQRGRRAASRSTTGAYGIQIVDVERRRRHPARRTRSTCSGALTPKPSVAHRAAARRDHRRRRAASRSA